MKTQGKRVSQWVGKWAWNGLLLSPLFALLSPLSAPAQSVKCVWEVSDETNVAGYHLLCGEKSRSYTITNTADGRMNNTGVITNLPAGRVFLAVQAFTTDGTLSDFSNEVSWTNRPPAPRNLRVSATMQASASPTGPWKDLAVMAVPVPPPLEAQRFYRAKVKADYADGEGVGERGSGVVGRDSVEPSLFPTSPLPHFPTPSLPVSPP